MLSFQKLDVYRASIELLALVVKIADSIPRGHAALIDQMLRATTSISLNIAEASGRRTRAEVIRSFTIARGEAMEVVAVVDVFAVLGVIDEDNRTRATSLLERIVAMLTRLCAVR